MSSELTVLEIHGGPCQPTMAYICSQCHEGSKETSWWVLVDVASNEIIDDRCHKCHAAAGNTPWLPPLIGGC